MKIITILSLCLIASLSFAHSETQDKIKDYTFTYDDSGLCADIPNCYPSMKNLPEIDDNSKFPPMPTRIDNSTICSSPSWSNFDFFVVGISEDGQPTHKDNAISYGDSGLYAKTPNHQPISKNLLKTLKKSSISNRIKTTATIHNVSRDKLDFITIGIDDKPIWSSHGEIEDSSYQRYFSLGFGFSSEADASINIQLFDSPVLLKDKQNYPSNIKHDF